MTTPSPDSAPVPVPVTPAAPPSALPVTPEVVPTSGTKPVTYEDVLPHVVPGVKTNADKIRKLLGRGSQGTIQKYLDQIRAEQTPVLPGTQAPPPPVPKDIMESLWSSAWSASQAMTHGRAERLSAQRDAALELIDTKTSDIAALNSAVDELLEKIVMAENDAVSLAEKAEADVASAMQTAAEAREALEKLAADKVKAEADAAQAAAQAAAEAAKVIDQLKAEKAKAETDAAHAAALAARDAQIADNVVQGTINKLSDKIIELTSQVADLKSLLRSTMAPAPAATTVQGGV